MTITTLRITDFRNLSAVEISQFQQQISIFSGDNGSGKTSLLEAIYYLGLGRSFRSSSSGRLIRHESDKFSIFAQILNESSRSVPLGVERNAKGDTKLRVAEQDVSSVAEIASYLPIRMINSQSHQLFESGPVHRRKYLDWGLFYHSDSFLPVWRNFERILKQRNAALKEKRPRNEIEIWTNELIKYGLELDSLRREYIQEVTPLISEILTALLPNSGDFQLTYSPGWDESQDYATILQNAYFEEMRFGHTLYGPHRADFDIQFDGISVKHILSRGQQKLLICAMILAQGKLLMARTNKHLIYLVDDLPSELDLGSRTKLVSLLAQQNTQIFITAIDYNDICQVLDVPMQVFHVEQGRISS